MRWETYARRLGGGVMDKFDKKARELFGRFTSLYDVDTEHDVALIAQFARDVVCEVREETLSEHVEDAMHLLLTKATPAQRSKAIELLFNKDARKCAAALKEI